MTSCAVITSTGTGVSVAVRDVRAPTTTTSFTDSGVAVSLKSAVTLCPAVTVTRCSAGPYPMSRARTAGGAAATLRRDPPFLLGDTPPARPADPTRPPPSVGPGAAGTNGP